jgi:hypothetical protein
MSAADAKALTSPPVRRATRSERAHSGPLLGRLDLRRKRGCGDDATGAAPRGRLGRRYRYTAAFQLATV